MANRLISSFMAAVVLATSTVPVSAQTYIYRHKYPMPISYQPGTPEDIAPENDIKAEFVAILGRPFSKTLPIETRDVVEWRIESGDIVPGLGLDSGSGEYGGTPEIARDAHHIAYGYDSRGTRIARADVSFRVFAPQGIRAEIDFYAHTGQYFFADIPTPQGIDVFRWEPFVDEAPGMATRVSAYEGTPTQAGAYTLAYQGYDVFGEPVAYAEGQLLVEDGPQVSQIADQTIDKQAEQFFNRKVSVARSIGTIGYKLVPVDGRPIGMTFDSAAGRIGGAYDDYDTSASYYIEATDSADGTTGVSNTFTLTTLPAELNLTNIPDRSVRVGSTFGPMRIRAGVFVPGIDWKVVSGTLPAGITLEVEERTGVAILKGRPTTREIQRDIVLEVSAPNLETRRTNRFRITVNDQSFDPYVATLRARIDQPLKTDGVCLTGRPSSTCTPPLGTDTYTFRLLSELPVGFTFDAATGVVSNPDGVSEPTAFPVQMVAVVGDEERSNRITQYVDVRRPLTLSYDLRADGYPLYEENDLKPIYDADAVFGTPRFTVVSGLLPDAEWLTFSRGRFAINPSSNYNVGTRQYQVRLTDDIGAPVTSDKFDLVITDRKSPVPTLRMPEIERLVTQGGYRLVWADNLFSPSRGGSYTFKLVDGRGQLPPGLTLAENGYLQGTTSAATGTVWPDIVVEVTDQLRGGSTLVGNNSTEPFTVTVVDPKGLGSLNGSFDKSFDWTVKRPMAIDLPKASGAIGKVTYTLSGPQVGDLAIVDGQLVGSVPDAGEYALTYLIKDESARPEVSGTVTLRILPAMTVTDEPYWDAYRHSWFQQSPKVVNGISPFEYRLLPSSNLPAERDWSLSADGELRGMPTEQNVEYPVAIEIKDATGTIKNFTTILRLNKPKDFTFSYATTRLNVGDSGTPLISPKMTNGTAPYEFRLLSGDVPGLQFAGSDTDVVKAGSFSGQATTAGVFDVAVTATDANGQTPLPDNPVRHQFLVGYTSPMKLTGETFTRRADKPFAIPLSAENAVLPTYSATDGSLPHGLSIDQVTGALTGKIESVGSFGGIAITASEDPRFGQDPVQATFTIETKDMPSADTAPAMTFTQYVDNTIPLVKTDNVIGKVTYEIDPEATPLPAGLKINPQTGAVEGKPTGYGSSTGHRILIVDTYGDNQRDVGGSNTFDITVAERPQLDLSYVDLSTSFKQYAAAESVPTLLNGAPGEVVYSVDPALPAGLSLSADGRIVATEPLKALAPTTFTVTAKDVTGVAGDDKGIDTFAVTISIERRPQLTASFAAPVTFTRHVRSTAVATAVNDVVYGDVVYEALSGAPSSIAFDNAEFGGKTTATAGTYTVKVRATDATYRDHGDTNGMVEFDIPVTVTDLDPIAFGYATPLSFKRHIADTGTAPAPAAPAAGKVVYAVAPTPPSCVTFDTDTGAFGTTGCTALIKTTTYVVTATDDRFATYGESNGRVETTVDVTVIERDPMGLTYPLYSVDRQTFDFQRHKTATADAEPTGQLTTELTWSITPDLPDGLSFDTTDGSISAATDAIIPAADYVVTVRDGKDGKADISLRIGVRERDPLAFITSLAQQVPLNTVWELTLSVANAIEAATFEVLSGDLPEGITFDADGSGDCGIAATFCGTPEVADHGKTFTVRVKASDAFHGEVEQDFGFTVVEDTTPITLVYGDPGRFRVGYPASVAAPTLTDTVGNYGFTAPALAALGLTIDANTGAISGTPNGVFETDVVVTVKDKVRTETTTLHLVSVPSARVEIGEDVKALYNRDLDPIEFAKAFDAVGIQNWTVAPILPNGLSIDPATGAFLGQPEVIGKSGPYVLMMTDELPGSFPTAPFYLDIKMNDDPIEMASPVILTKVGFDVAMAVGEYDNEYGTPRFSSPELVALGLSVNPDTGEITGKVNEVYKGTPNIVIKDDTLRTTTVPVDLTVLPKMVLVAPASISINAQETMTPRAITAQAVAGTLTWDMIDPTLLPPDVTFNTATGQFEGTPSLIGTYGPFKITATDTFGAGQTDTASTGDVTIVVRKGAIYVNLLGDKLPDATKRKEYSFDMLSLVDPETQGVDMSELRWSLSGQPNGLSINPQTGLITGTPTLSGDYKVTVTASALKRFWPKTYDLKVKLPEVTLELAAAEGKLPTAKRAVTAQDMSYRQDIVSQLTYENVPFDDIKWEIEPLQQGESWPAGLSISKGVISGTATSAAGTYNFRIKASYKDGPDEDYFTSAPFSMNVIDTIKFELLASEGPLTAKKRLAAAIDFTPFLKDVEGFDQSKLTWTMALDPMRDVTTTMKELPRGLSFTGAVLGGTPVNSGVYDLVVTASYDGREKIVPYRLNVGLQTIALEFAAGIAPKATVAEAMKDFDFRTVLTPTNIPIGEVKWSLLDVTSLPADASKGLPNGVEFKTSTGVLSGTPTQFGNFAFTVKATWDNKDAEAEHAETTVDVVLAVSGAGKILQMSLNTSSAYPALCTLRENGTVWCKGSNTRDALGNPSVGGTTYDFVQVMDTPSVPLKGAKAISSGDGYTCAFRTAGNAYCWGANNYYGLGWYGNNDGTAAALGSVNGGSGRTNIAQVTAGDDHGCYLSTDGTVWCWGRNAYGERGDANTTASYSSRQVAGLTNVKDVAAGAYNTCAVKEDGSAWCWGYGLGGRLGNGSTSTNPSVANSYTPVQVIGLESGVSSISVGTGHSCAVKTDGTVWCWGVNSAGALGDGTTTLSRVATQVKDFSGAVSVVALYDYSCAVKSDGTAWCWGNNNNGKLGDGTTTARTTPVQVKGLTNVTSITGGRASSNTLATTSDGKGWSWGYGMHGVGRSESLVPVEVN